MIWCPATGNGTSDLAFRNWRYVPPNLTLPRKEEGDYSFQIKYFFLPFEGEG